MSQALTAQDLFVEMKRMPPAERIKFFALIASRAFRDDDFTHNQVFGQVNQEPFSASEAAEYLEVSLPTLFAARHCMTRGSEKSTNTLCVWQCHVQHIGRIDSTIQ